VTKRVENSGLGSALDGRAARTSAHGMGASIFFLVLRSDSSSSSSQKQSLACDDSHAHGRRGDDQDQIEIRPSSVETVVRRPRPNPKGESGRQLPGKLRKARPEQVRD
jgi:hypothetical protein